MQGKQLALFKRPYIIQPSLVRHLIAAVDVVIETEEYAPEHLGRRLRFSSKDIRALAIAGFIQQGRRRP